MSLGLWLCVRWRSADGVRGSWCRVGWGWSCKQEHRASCSCLSRPASAAVSRPGRRAERRRQGHVPSPKSHGPRVLMQRRYRNRIESLVNVTMQRPGPSEPIDEARKFSTQKACRSPCAGAWPIYFCHCPFFLFGVIARAVAARAVAMVARIAYPSPAPLLRRGPPSQPRSRSR